MVRAVEAGVFGCERYLCHQTFTAEDPTNKDAISRTRQEASIHERRNAPHIKILDLSTLPQQYPNKPDTMRRGFVVALETLRGVKILAGSVYAEEQGAAPEALYLVQIAEDADLAREEKPRGRWRIRNSIPT